MWKSSSDLFPSRARHGTKKNQSFGDMRIPGNIGPVSLVPVCAMRVINGLPPANLICFIINPTKAVWPGLGWPECMRVQVAWSGNYPPHGNHHHCLHSVRTSTLVISSQRSTYGYVGTIFHCCCCATIFNV